MNVRANMYSGTSFCFSDLSKSTFFSTCYHLHDSQGNYSQKILHVKSELQKPSVTCCKNVSTCNRVLITSAGVHRPAAGTPKGQNIFSINLSHDISITTMLYSPKETQRNSPACLQGCPEGLHSEICP